MRNTLYITVVSLALLAGCSRSNDFNPSGEMSGEDIFKAACVECHKPEGGHVMAIGAFMKDADKIANKVLQGSLMMPSFPNIQGEPAKKLAEYVLANSATK